MKDCSTETCLETKALDEILASIPDVGEDNLVPILQQVQHAYGHLPYKDIKD